MDKCVLEYGMIIMFIIIIYLFINLKKCLKKTETKENFALSTEDLSLVRNEINRIYNMDVEAIRNLGAISKSLLTGTNTFTPSTTGTPGDLTIPADNTILQKNLKVLGNSDIIGDTKVTGNLFVHGKQLIPLGIIMAWYKPDAPAGWGLCNGTKYGEIPSPDLRGRFIKMYTPGMKEGNNLYNVTDTRNKDINTYQRDDNQGIIRYTEFGVTGGSDYRVLTIKEMPSHSHGYNKLDMSWQHWNAGGGGQLHWIGEGQQTESTGGNSGHGINSPYYTLVYIIYIG